MKGGIMMAIGTIEFIFIILVGFGGILVPVVMFVVLLLILNSLKKIERFLEQQVQSSGS
jgi:hypothetical protein